MLPLTRTACLIDFPDCWSVADWQQRIVEAAYAAWAAEYIEVYRTPCATLTRNWGAAAFRAPPTYGAGAAYYQGINDDLMIYTAPLCAIYALSVLDRIDAPLRFLRQQADLLCPGGLIVCTFAAWDASGPDCAVGSPLRQRIYNRHSWHKLLIEMRQVGLSPFGGVDLRYHGDTLGDHTLASIVAIKDRSSE